MSDWSRTSGWTSDPFRVGPQPEARDVTFKVKYEDTLKRFYGSANGINLDINLSTLRAKIANAFKFGPDAEFILTYMDEDGDAVMLDDDGDLRDAALHQKLNPLRITVQLKNNHATEQQKTDSESLKSTAQDPLSQILSMIEALKPMSKSSTAQEKCLAQIKSAVSEATKAILEPIPDSLAKLSHEVTDSAPPTFEELIKTLVQLITPSNGNNGSSSSLSGVTQTQMPAKANDELKVTGNLVSQPLNVQKSELPKEKGHRSVIDEAAATAAAAPSAGTSQGQHDASLYPSVKEFMFPSSSVDECVNKGNNTQNKGKSVMSSTEQFTPPVVPTLIPPLPPSISEWFQPQRCHSHRWQYDTNTKDTIDSIWHVPMHNGPFGPSATFPYASSGYGSSPHFPYPGRLLSSGRVYRDHGNKRDKLAEPSVHRLIQCDGCGMQPIIGPRYKSNVREDYDLCESCFKRMGDEVEYTEIDKPLLNRLSSDPNVYRKVHPRVPMRSKREKLESRFVLDVTVLDGTLMAPSTQFTKIWRMHNNGSIVWPLGTQLIWVGGDHLSLLASVPLEIPVSGFPVDKEIDVAVDFWAPTRPGRYISYWRLASPSGQKFGQRVWVHIQVEEPFVNDRNKNAINLNLPPESNSLNTINLIDANMESFTGTEGYHSYPVDMSLNAFDPKKSQSTPFKFVVPSVSAEASTDPVADAPLSSAPATAVAPSVSASAPEPVLPATPLPISVPNMAATTPVANAPVSAPNMAATIPVANIPVSVSNITATTSVDVLASAPAPALESAPAPALESAPAPVDASVFEPFGIDGDTEQKLLRELEEMGFKQVDLNKEILRQNKYNLEQSVDDLCGVNEWDPLLAELEEMGFDDKEMNKELLANNGGSIKRAVMDLIAREKDI